jgi:hypothetical protein
MPFTTILVAIRNMVLLNNKFQIIHHYEQLDLAPVLPHGSY